MAYALDTDLEAALTKEELVRLTDDDGDSVADVAVVDSILTRASGRVDAYIGTRYVVPLSGTIPELIKDVTVAIASYLAWVRRDAPNDVRKYEYRQAMTTLRKIANGELSIAAELLASASVERGAGDDAVFASDRVFSRETLEDF